MYVGDSQTMATEAAVVGTPAIRSNSFAGENDMSNFVELEEEYELLYSTPQEEAALRRVREHLEDTDLDETWNHRRQRLLEEKRDVTDIIVETIEEGEPI
jgi:predicted glycosyltransferase